MTSEAAQLAAQRGRLAAQGRGYGVRRMGISRPSARSPSRVVISTSGPTRSRGAHRSRVSSHLRLYDQCGMVSSQYSAALTSVGYVAGFAADSGRGMVPLISGWSPGWSTSPVGPFRNFAQRRVCTELHYINGSDIFRTRHSRNYWSCTWSSLSLWKVIIVVAVWLGRRAGSHEGISHRAPAVTWRRSCCRMSPRRLALLFRTYTRAWEFGMAHCRVSGDRALRSIRGRLDEPSSSAFCRWYITPRCIYR